MHAFLKRAMELHTKKMAFRDLLTDRGNEVADLSKKHNDPAMQSASKNCGEEFLKLKEKLENKSEVAARRRHEAWREMLQHPFQSG